MTLLVTAAVSVAFFHSLAPDHWLPFVALAKSSKWSVRQLAGITTLAGIGHVASSLVIGMIGLWAGWALHHLQGVEVARGSIAVWLLIGFGVAYAMWGLKHAQHHHPHISVQDAVKAYAARRFWILMAVVVFGPCEPLIPLMFLSYERGLIAVAIVSIVFSIVTIAMVVGQSCLGYLGVRLLQFDWMERYAHSLAGGVIALTGIAVLVIGI